MAVKENFSVLIIGCGAIAGGYDAEDIPGPNILTHAKAFNTHQGFDLVGCLDVDQATAQSFADTWQVNKAYASLEQALSECDFDIISICTSTPSHESYLRQLNNYDMKLIFCEKPITDNLSSAREMSGLYKDNMTVNYLRRFDPEIRQLSSNINRGEYGRFISGKAKYNKGLYNNGSHMTDLLHMLFGSLKVKAAGEINHDYWPDDPTLSARLETDSGAQIGLIGSNVRNGMIFDLELVFEQAQISLTDFSNTINIRPKDRPGRQIKTSLKLDMLHAVSNIYDHLTLGTKLCSNAENALLALETCGTIRKMAGLKG